MNFDRHDPLWDLLGQARDESPSPWLATRVIAAVRQPEAPATWGARLSSWLRASLLRPVAAGASLLLVVGVVGVATLHHATHVNGYVSPETGQLAAALDPPQHR